MGRLFDASGARTGVIAGPGGLSYYGEVTLGTRNRVAGGLGFEQDQSMLPVDHTVWLVNRVITCLLAIGVVAATIDAILEWRQRRTHREADRAPIPHGYEQ